MERQLSQLVRLTDDLLDVSRITRNRIELRRDRIDVREALASAIETTQPLIDAAGHSLDVALPPSRCGSTPT
jgi:signal transduction histidine kinase